MGFPIETVYKKAEDMYEGVASGAIKVEADRSEEVTTSATEEEGSEY
jgi:hypothetical protein